MTPRQLSLLTGLACGFTYRNADDEAHKELRTLEESEQLVRKRRLGAEAGEWILTERGKVYVEHLRVIPLPVQEAKWVMPAYSRP